MATKPKDKTTEAPKGEQTREEYLPGTAVKVDLVSPIGSLDSEKAQPGVVMTHFVYKEGSLAGKLSGQCAVKFDGSGKTLTCAIARFIS